ncbi:unnamed protein product [Closterium sp. Yama58-4]|nr:unnamed protein product [Closterium sp. Yama58-4]
MFGRWSRGQEAKHPTPPRSSPSPPPATGGEVSSAPSQSNTARRYRRLVAQCDTVGEAVDSVNRDLDSLTTLIVPENLAEFRKDILTCIKKSLCRTAFPNNTIPPFQPIAGEPFKAVRRSYLRQHLQWPTAADAAAFRASLPITFTPPNGHSVELKEFVDPEPDYTEAKDRGETHLVVRNVPVGYNLATIHSILVSRSNRAGQKWLADLLHFHMAYDPYEELYHNQIHGIPVAMPGDACFNAIPPLIWLPGSRVPVFVHLSCHSCNICSSNHRTIDHHVFPVTRRGKINNPHSLTLLPACISSLDSPISHVEVERAFTTLARGKTLGTDGLSGDLFRAHKSTLVPVVHKLFGNILNHNALPPSMLEGRTVLIPKKGNSALVENLRPITLMNSDYKLLAITLANRLQSILPRIIHHAQTAFVKGRKIGDTINDSLDLMDWAALNNLPMLVLTVDIRKAYDMVDREFLFRCLSHLGIPPAFVAWVRRLHSNNYTHVSVNNAAGPRFQVRTGVRQGCPLAPLLFLCVIEVLQRYLSTALPGFAISPVQQRLMACYADDVSIFLNSDSELLTAKEKLDEFARCSGEYPNWDKCTIIPFNVPISSISNAGCIPIRQSDEAERILGIYVERDQPGLTTWDHILSKKIYAAVSDEWWATLTKFAPAPGYLTVNDWAFEAIPSTTHQRILRVTRILDNQQAQPEYYDVTSRRVSKTPAREVNFGFEDVITVCVIDGWEAPPRTDADPFSAFSDNLLGAMLLRVACNGVRFGGQDCPMSDEDEADTEKNIDEALIEPLPSESAWLADNPEAPVRCSSSLVSFRHALVCKRRLRVARFVVPSIVVPLDRFFSARALASLLRAPATVGFPNLRHLHLAPNALDTVDPALMRAICAGSGPSLTPLSLQLYDGWHARQYPPPGSARRRRRTHCSTALPESLGQLPALRDLKFLNNGRITHLSPSLSASSTLEHLSLHNCQALSALPDAIGHIPTLERVDLSFLNALTALPVSLGGASRLQELRIVSCSRLVGLPPSVSALASLARLTFDGCAAWALPEDFGQLSNLVRLKLSCRDLAALPRSFGQLKKLQELRLYACYGLLELPVSFANLSSLETLAIYGGTHLPAALLRAPPTTATLGADKLRHTETAGEPAWPPPTPFSVTTQDESPPVYTLMDDPPLLDELVQRLLGRCLLHSLPAYVSQLMRLQQLVIDGCDALERLPEGLGRLAGLQVLHPARLALLSTLQYLAIVKTRLPLLPSNLSDLKSLKVLILERCICMPSLPASLPHLSNLEKLVLSTLPRLARLPKNLGQLKSLKELSVEACDALVGLPASIGLLSSLVLLSIIECDKFSSLPNSIGSLPCLASLKLNGLFRLRRLPESISRLPALVILSLEDCEELRALPEGLAGVGTLREVIIGGCGRLKSLPQSLLDRQHVIDLQGVN